MASVWVMSESPAEESNSSKEKACDLVDIVIICRPYRMLLLDSLLGQVNEPHFTCRVLRGQTPVYVADLLYSYSVQ